MAGRGGYQAPANPAPASGPGHQSKRTDGGPAQKLRDLPDARYGEASEFRALQQQAPLAQSPSLSAASPGGAGAAPAAPVTPIPLTAPSLRPDEPVTAGSPLGAGPGPEALGPVGPGSAYLNGIEVLKAMAPNAAVNPEVAALLQRLQARGL